jgi:hypothetical protein
MGFLLAGLAGLALILLVVWLFATADPASLVRLVRYAVAFVLLGTAAVFAIGGRWGTAFFLGALGVSAISIGRIGPLDFGSTRRAKGSGSTVRSAFLEMRLDHDSGTMAGRVTAGRYAGQNLDDLTEPSLRELLEEVAGDADSLALVEGYLDRRFAGWRENVEGDEAPRPRSAPDASAMTDQQAYEILGLSPGAGEAEIRAAHRRLMKAVHPDQGGSTFLAAKINQAKDWLLGGHRKDRTRDSTNKRG